MLKIQVMEATALWLPTTGRWRSRNRQIQDLLQFTLPRVSVGEYMSGQTQDLVLAGARKMYPSLVVLSSTPVPEPEEELVD